MGYALASLLVLAYWPENNRPSFGEVLLIGLVFGWLGLAMSGPVVLMIRRPAPVAPEDDDRPEPRTWAELAWMIIGVYWIGLAMLVVPLRMNGSRLMDSARSGFSPCSPRRYSAWSARNSGGPAPAPGATSPPGPTPPASACGRPAVRRARPDDPGQKPVLTPNRPGKMTFRRVRCADRSPWRPGKSSDEKRAWAASGFPHVGGPRPF